MVTGKYNVIYFLVLILVIISCAGKIEPGSCVSDFRLKDIYGNDYFFNSNKKKIVIIVFWATWCKYCIQELSLLSEIYKGYSRERVEIISVLTDTQNSDLAGRITENNLIQIPVLLDEKQSVSKKFNIRYLPYTVIIDKKQVCRFKYSGFSNEDIKIIKRDIDTLLKW